jgi:hypothetical protein
MALLVTLAILLFTSAIPFECWQKSLGVGLAGIATLYFFAVFGPLAITVIQRLKQE